VEAVRCQGLTRHYGDVTALDGLDLIVKENIIFGFLGPNGAGKTTTVKMLTGLSLPSAGKAWVAGEEVKPDATSLRAKIGYLPDVPAFYPWMTGQEFLRFVGEIHRLPPREISLRCDELLELVDLQSVAKRKVGGYSRGMKQRLGIAQALVNHPRVLFMYEPTSALDPMGRRDVLSLIQRLASETTIFMSTHILSDVERVCDVVAIINRGKLVTESSVEELRHRYARSVIELEFEEEPASLVARLESIPWVARVETVTVNDAPAVRVQARDIKKAKIELPKIVTASGLTLLRYELTLPSIEDIFVELVADEGK